MEEVVRTGSPVRRAGFGVRDASAGASAGAGAGGGSGGGSGGVLRRGFSPVERHVSDAAMPPPPPPPDYTWAYGWTLLVVAYVGFAVSMYALVVSKWMPLTGNKILDWIAQDEYYCYLLPATLPVTVYMVLWNWMSMKFFRHN